MRGRYPIPLLTAAGAAALLLSACGSAGQQEPTTTAAQSRQSTGQQVSVPAEDSITCPGCGSGNLKEGDRSYTSETREPETCPYDELFFETNVVLASTEYTCSDCGKEWVQGQRYTLSRCPAHGDITNGYESFVESEQ